MRPLDLFVSLAIAMTVCGGPVRACPMTEPLTDALKARAEVVLEGSVTAYEIQKDKESALVTFAVTKSIKGSPEKEQVVVFVQNFNVTLPGNLEEFVSRYGSTSEVGLVLPAGTDGEKPDLLQAPEPHRKLPVIVQENCSEPCLIHVTAE